MPTKKTPLKNKRGYTNKQEKHCPVKIRQRCVKVPQTFSKKNLELVINYTIFVPALVFHRFGLMDLEPACISIRAAFFTAHKQKLYDNNYLTVIEGWRKYL
jgi:hypothetical protein